MGKIALVITVLLVIYWIFSPNSGNYHDTVPKNSFLNGISTNIRLAKDRLTFDSDIRQTKELVFSY